MSALRSYMVNDRLSSMTSLEPETISCLDQSNLTPVGSQDTTFKWHHQVEERHYFDEMLDSYNSSNNLVGVVRDFGLLDEVVSRSWNSGAAAFEDNGWYSSAGHLFRNASAGDNGPNGPFCYGNFHAETKLVQDGNVDNSSENVGVEPIQVTSSTSRYRETEMELMPECASSEDRGSGIGLGRGNTKKRQVARKVARSVRRNVCGEDECSQISNKTSSRSASSTPKRGGSSKKEYSGETSKDESKVTEVQKTDYIHVRARRGQATDSHSLAERVRREKISERMKCLQNLVPGCNKVTGKAGMLDEIINYVQALQRQVEFLSMKLSCVYPALDFDTDNLYHREGLPFFPSYISYTDHNPSFPMKREIEEINAAPDTIRSLPASFPDSSVLNSLQHAAAWDAEIRGLYDVAFGPGRPTTLPQLLAGPPDIGNVKMEI